MKRIHKALLAIALVPVISGCSHHMSSAEQSRAQLHAYSLAESDIKQGISYMNAGNMEMAETKLKNAVSVAPNLPKAQYTWGYLQLKMGNMELAKQAYDQAIALAPNDPEVLNSYGIYLCKSGQYKASIPYFLKAVKTPDFQHVDLAYQNAGICAAQIPDDEQAEMYLERAIQQNMKLSLAYLKLANLYFMHGHYDKASDYLDRYNQMADATPESERLEQDLASVKAAHLRKVEARDKLKMQQVQDDLQKGK